MNLRLLSMLHRLKNRKSVIEEAYESLKRKGQEGEQPEWGVRDERFFEI